MRTLTYFSSAALLLILTACGGGDTHDAGTSSGTLYVKATVSSSNGPENTQDSKQFLTHYSVYVEKQGTQVVTATVTLKVGGAQVPLVNQASSEPGYYTVDAYGLPTGDVELDVDAGPGDFLRGAVLTAPGLHWFTQPLPNSTGLIYPANTPLKVSWNRPAAADSAHLEVASYHGNVADSGSYVVDGQDLGVQNDATCELTRTNKVLLSGAASSKNEPPLFQIDVTQSLTFTLQ